jgi:serine/threonine protein kinase
MPSGEPAVPNKPSQAQRWSVDELIPFGKYILLNKISSGATAAVYRAKIRGEAGFERLVTIKRVLPQMAGDPEFVETFIREAKISARLSHSNICPIYELGKVGESLYMALEWVPGKDLGAIARRLQYTGKIMRPLIAAWIGSRLCDALDYAHSLKDASGHSLGILHQDLSPANIVISYEGQVKLIDFGIARASGRAQQTNVEALKQKIGYMSPESVLGVPLDPRSDVFGVGVCLYEMVTGRRLFAGTDDIATLKLVSSATVPPPSALLEDTPEDLEQIIMRALQRDPEQRWQSAGEMAHALTACIAGEDPTFGTRNLTEFMHELFEPDMKAEQRRQNDLIAASHDQKLMEERRRFFATPLGAAAIAKAEAARKLASTRPPPPMAESLKPPPVKAPAVLQSQAAPAEASDDELTTYQAEARPHRHSEPDHDAMTRAATFEELLKDTTADPAQVSDSIEPDPDDDDDEDEDEDDALTTFRPENGDATVIDATGALADNATTLRPSSPPDASAMMKPASDPAPEDEATAYFDRDAKSAPKPHPLDAAIAAQAGQFEDEATHIFFSSEEGIGLPDVPDDEQTTIAPPTPLRVQAPTGQAGGPRARAPQASALGTGQHRPLPPMAARAAAPATWSDRSHARSETLLLETPPTPRAPMFWIAGALLAVTLAGVVLKTPVGIALGLRKPPDGVIEVRTLPELPAAVRLDGIYRGRAPLRLENVPSGDRVLTLEADGYQSVTRRISLEGGGVVRENVSLQPQPAATASP